MTILKAARRAAETYDEKAAIDGVRNAWKVNSWATIVELAGLSPRTTLEDCRHLGRILAMFWQNVDAAGIECILRYEARKGRKASRLRRVQGSVISATNHLDLSMRVSIKTISD